MEATDIVEVIGEFVQLKKRGANYIGLSPFANERTPSFTVSPAKGIFKDFSSGKGGSAVTFLMELEKFTYPEALKWLAKKYGIEVEETVVTEENKEEENRRESLMIVSGYAAKFFQDSLWETDEGQSIGLSYFKERGFTNETIRKFELGYSPDQWEAFSAQALKEGYLEEFIVESGLSVKRENGSLYDRYRGRVMFPIHSYTGRVIAFGGRTLKSDKNVPKYVNSPESEIYHKSNVLYGWHLATKAIRSEDTCYLVEGYADVISLHQAGVENVVASSGTSLTVEQITTIQRQTKNVTILYDGDAAGVKASLRGLDLMLDQGLNVNVVLFPDGNDPDSYVRLLGSSAFKKYLIDNSKDFIIHKAGLIIKEVKSDPIKKAEGVNEIAETLAKIKDQFKREEYTRRVKQVFDIDERSLISLVNHIIVKNTKKNFQQPYPSFEEETEQSSKDAELDNKLKDLLNSGEPQEKEIVRLLLLYGNRMIDWDGIANTYIGPFMIAELSDVEFEHAECKQFVSIYKDEVDNGKLPDEQLFIHYPDKAIVDLAVTMLATRYTLSENWLDMHKIFVPDEEVKIRAAVLGGIFHLKKQKVNKILEKLLRDIQESTSETDQEILMSQYLFMKKVERKILDFFGTVIPK
jgi:DNA primase